MVIIAVLRSADGEDLGAIILNQRTFRTGSTGYAGQAKVTIGGERFQGQVQLLKIGSKAAVAPDAGAATGTGDS